MNDDLDHPRTGPSTSGHGHGAMSSEPLLVEDALLLLFQPETGTIAGENILFYVLGGAALGDLALAAAIDVENHGSTNRISATGNTTSIDPLLDRAWSYISEKPRDAQAVLAAVGPPLRGPVLDRLIERGDLTREAGKAFGFLPFAKYALGSDRREHLMQRVRAVLIDGNQPDPRTGAVIALISASGTLPQFHREIPWSGDVYTRGKDIERGDWGASATSAAVMRTMNATIINAIIAATLLPRI